MKYLIIFLLASFPLGQLARFNISGTEIVLHPNDLVVAITLICWAITRRKDLISILKTNPMTKPLFFFGLSIFISLAFKIFHLSSSQIIASSLYPVRFFAYAGLFYLFVNLKQVEKELTERWLIIATLIIAGFGLLQYIFVPNLAFLSALDWDDHYYRLVGSFLDPGFTGAILALGLVLIFLRTKVLIKLTSFLTFLPAYFALALTYSRASYLMYIIMFGVIAFYRRSVKVFLVASLILAITIPLLPKSTGEGTKLGRENSILARLENWRQSIAIWGKSPLVGIGFNTYRYEAGIAPQSHSGGADSSLLLVLATTGILGLLAYLNLLGVMWRVGWKSSLFKAALTGIFVHSWFNNTLFYPWVMEWLWLLLAIVSGKIEDDRS